MTQKDMLESYNCRRKQDEVIDFFHGKPVMKSVWINSDHFGQTYLNGRGRYILLQDSFSITLGSLWKDMKTCAETGEYQLAKTAVHYVKMYEISYLLCCTKDEEELLFSEGTHNAISLITLTYDRVRRLFENNWHRTGHSLSFGRELAKLYEIDIREQDRELWRIVRSKEAQCQKNNNLLEEVQWRYTRWYIEHDHVGKVTK